MDPNECLKKIRSLCMLAQTDGLGTDEAKDLAEHIQALDGWISKGGFLPSDWDVKGWVNPVCNICIGDCSNH
jgi:hypothetical protein